MFDSYFISNAKDKKSLGVDFLSTVKTRAVVIKNKDYKENDKLVTIFSESHGKVNVIVRGAKRVKNSKLPLTLPFSFCDYVLYKGKTMFTLNEGSIIESFQDFLKDLETLTYTTYILELIDIALVEEEPNYKVFKDVIASYYFIKNKVLPIELLVMYFELKVLKNTGFNFEFNRCSTCKAKIISSNYFSLSQGGGVCNKCPKDDGLYISYETYSLLKHISAISIEELIRLNLSIKVKNESRKLLSYIIQNSFDKKPKSLEILNLL